MVFNRNNSQDPEMNSELRDILVLLPTWEQLRLSVQVGRVTAGVRNQRDREDTWGSQEKVTAGIACRRGIQFQGDMGPPLFYKVLHVA